MTDPRPCGGTNSNVCVAEGCYGEACLRESGRREIRESVAAWIDDMGASLQLMRCEYDALLAALDVGAA